MPEVVLETVEQECKKMKLQKAQTIKVGFAGYTKVVPIQLIELEEKTVEPVLGLEDTNPYIFGGFASMTNPFAAPTTTTKKVTSEKLFNVSLMLDGKEDVLLECLEVGFAGKQHKFKINKGKDSFLAYLSEEALNQIVDN